MKKEIVTQIKINAPKFAVWQVLVDFEKYPAWNPFVKSLKGNVEVGERIKIKLPGIKFAPTVSVYEENRMFTWRGSLFVKGFFDGEHRFVLSENKDGSTQFEHAELFSGILVAALSKKLDIETKLGFEAMNLKLKARVERIYKSL